MQCDEFTVFRRKSQKLIDIYRSMTKDKKTLQWVKKYAIVILLPL